MAREASITYEQVAAAANSIKTLNEKVTTRSVREVLGSGSMATVLKFLQQWQGQQARPSIVIEDALDPAIVRAIGHQIASRIQEATSETIARLAELQFETDSIIVESERQSIEIEEQAAELISLQGRYDALAGRAMQIEFDAKQTSGNLIAERKASEAARVELAKAELRLEGMPKIESDIEKLRTEILKGRTHAAELHEAAAVAMAKLESEVSQRKGIQAQLAEVTRRAEEAAKRAEASAEALVKERHNTQVCQSKLAAAGREIAAAKEATSQARSEAKKSNESANIALIEAKKSSEEAAELRGRLIGLNKS